MNKIEKITVTIIELALYYAAIILTVGQTNNSTIGAFLFLLPVFVIAWILTINQKEDE